MMGNQNKNKNQSYENYYLTTANDVIENDGKYPREFFVCRSFEIRTEF